MRQGLNKPMSETNLLLASTVDSLSLLRYAFLKANFKGTFREPKLLSSEIRIEKQARNASGRTPAEAAEWIQQQVRIKKKD